MDSPLIDSHQHFWKYDPKKHPWITDDMKSLRRDFLPSDSYVDLVNNGNFYCIAVQALNSQEETEFLLKLAKEYPHYIKGVVGWIDFQGDDVEEKLEYYVKQKVIVGFRHLVQDEEDDRFLLRKEFLRGFQLLSKYNYTFDILVYPRHLKVVKEFVSMFPQQKFVLDHIGKPNIKEHEIEEWEKDLREIAKYENVCIKLSGLVTEADLNNFKESDFIPYMDVVFDAFGPHRIMFGSDWPMLTLCTDMKTVLDIVRNYISNLSEEDRRWVLGGTAASVYNISTRIVDVKKLWPISDVEMNKGSIAKHPNYCGRKF